MLKVALAGCGKAADNHIREIQKLSSARVVAVCDIEPLMAEQLAVRFGVANYYSDLEVMLEAEKPNVVHITSPPQSHLPLALLALDAGCDVLVEKPLALDYADTERLIAHASTRRRKLTIGYGYYFDPIARAMRTMIAEGVLGDPVHVESHLGYALTGQFGAPIFADSDHWVHDLPGKLLHNVIDHLLNKVTEFVVGDAPMIEARAWQRARGPCATYSMPDELRVMVTDDRVSAYATFSAHARPLAHSLTVYGTKNTFRLDFLAGTITLASVSALPGAFGRLAPTFGQAFQYFRQGSANVLRLVRSEYQYLDGLGFLISAFYESILRGSPAPVANAEMLRVAAITESVFAQLRQGRVLVT